MFFRFQVSSCYFPPQCHTKLLNGQKVLPFHRTCFLNLPETHSVTTAALTEAVGVSEGMQGGNRRQIWTQTKRPTQQPQSDQWARPPQNLHGSLLTAALQTHPIHLKRRTARTTESGEVVKWTECLKCIGMCRSITEMSEIQCRIYLTTKGLSSRSETAICWLSNSAHR